MKTFTVAWIINLLLLFSMSWISYGQSHSLRFEQLLLQQDLSHSSVWAICQDSEGFMWFGTLDGLNKCEGLHEVDKRTGKVTPYCINLSRINQSNSRFNLRHLLF